jgi:hypothetical protein
MFRRKNRLSLHLYLWSFQGHLRKYCGLFCATAFTPKASLEFIVDASVACLKVKGLKGREEGNEKRRKEDGCNKV